VVQVVEDGPQNFAPSVCCHQTPGTSRSALDATADRQVAGARSDRAVFADLHHQRVEVDDRVDGLKRPRAPRLDVGEHRVGDPADRVALDLHAIEIAEVRLDVAS